MIENSGKYYLYSHVRLDKNEPFYIGVGCKESGRNYKKFESEYQRAFQTKARNDIWKSITLKTGFEVNILLETNDKKFLEEKEIEFVELYGRIVLGTGSLANLHRGGNYKDGHKLSDEQRKAISERFKGENSPVSLKVYNTETKEIYNSIIEASKIYKVDSTSLSDILRGFAKNNFPLMLYDDFLKGDYRAFSFVNGHYCPVINFKTLERFENIKLAANSINIDPIILTEYLSGRKCYNPTNFIKVTDYEKGLTPQTLFKGKRQKQEVYNIKTKEVYSSVREASEKTGYTEYALYHKLGGSSVNDTDLIYKKDFDKGLLPKDLRKDGKKKQIIDKVSLKEYNSIKEASDDIGISEKSLGRYLSGNRKNTTNLQYLSEYIKENPHFKSQ